MRFYDPEGTRHGVPTFPFRLAPDGLRTRRQLRARGLRPGGQGVAAQVMWASRFKGRVMVAYLYRLDQALVRPMTPGRAQALAAANTARRVCPACRRDAGYVIPSSLGTCVPCHNTAALAA